MAINSKIEWTDDTFNPWMGCARVSPACENCYAEKTADKRLHRAKWGTVKQGGTRHRTSADNWAKVKKLHREAEREGVRRRIFCASWADVFEDFPGLDEIRVDLWKLIEATPHLDWLLLTKRPENIGRMVPKAWSEKGWPANVWLGCTVENQTYADKRIPHLIQHPAAVRFLSVEPMLGPVDLSAYISELDWVINGGESGKGAGIRKWQTSWIYALRDQVLAAGKAYFFKQWGVFGQLPEASRDPELVQIRIIRKKEGEEKPGKYRLLDGVLHDAYPTPVRRFPAKSPILLGPATKSPLLLGPAKVEMSQVEGWFPG